MKIGLSIKVDVTKIDKARLHEGKKGTYLDLTTFIDTEKVSQYGDNGIVSQSLTKEEREQNKQLPILGNARVFYTGESEKKEEDPNFPQEEVPGLPSDQSFNDQTISDVTF